MDGMRKGAVTCSHSCRTAAYRQRNKSTEVVVGLPVMEAIKADCLNCGCVLRGRQRSYCSDRCRKQYGRDIAQASLVFSESTQS
jgi:hypothetical protein